MLVSVISTWSDTRGVKQVRHASEKLLFFDSHPLQAHSSSVLREVMIERCSVKLLCCRRVFTGAFMARIHCVFHLRESWSVSFMNF
jgi:hypothetical protein